MLQAVITNLYSEIRKKGDKSTDRRRQIQIKGRKENKT
jgi:hypothetical protein